MHKNYVLFLAVLFTCSFSYTGDVKKKDVKRTFQHQLINGVVGTTAACYGITFYRPLFFETLGTSLAPVASMLPAFFPAVCSRMVSFVTSYYVLPLMIGGLCLSTVAEKKFMKASEVMASMEKHDLTFLRTLCEIGKPMFFSGVCLTILSGIAHYNPTKPLPSYLD